MPKYDDFMDIATILNDYSKEIYEEMQIASNNVAKDGVSKLKQTSPKRTGGYAKSWRIKKQQSAYGFSSTIYNTKGQLTHLLEKPHAKRNGRGTVTPQVHIRPVEQECIRDYEKDVVNIIKKGA